jgi:Tfp pilus assembly protein PilX
MEKIIPINDKNGSVVVLALIMVVLLSLLGMAVTRTSSIDVQISSNETQAVKDLYQAESADNCALEDTNTWMTNTFLTNSQTTTYWKKTDFDADHDGVPDTLLEIRCIVTPSAYNNNVSAGANNLPVMEHISPPPPGSGYSLKYFEVRRYGITATTNTTKNVVQLGAYKVFNKF